MNHMLIHTPHCSHYELSTIILHERHKLLDTKKSLMLHNVHVIQYVLYFIKQQLPNFTCTCSQGGLSNMAAIFMYDQVANEVFLWFFYCKVKTPNTLP